jgi:CHAD domain-containing protein
MCELPSIPAPDCYNCVKNNPNVFLRLDEVGYLQLLRPAVAPFILIRHQFSFFMDRDRSLLNKLKKTLNDAATGPDAAAVHLLRTTTRRVETRLPVEKQTAKLHKVLKRLRRRAGKVRDVDVQVTALSKLRFDESSSARQSVLRALQKQRMRQQKKLVSLITDELNDKLPSRMTRARGAFPSVSAEPDAARPIAVQRATDDFLDLVAKTELTEEHLHAFRVNCKRIRYALEPYEDEAGAEEVLTLLKTIQDAVGEWHDWVTLSATAQKTVPGNSLVKVIQTRAKSLFVEALRVISDSKLVMLSSRDHAAFSKKPPGRVSPRPGALRASN